jgi:hypothetical protein
VVQATGAALARLSGRGWFERSQLSSTLIIGCETGFRRPSPALAAPEVGAFGALNQVTLEIVGLSTRFKRVSIN